jgi:hypothetical protein
VELGVGHEWIYLIGQAWSRREVHMKRDYNNRFILIGFDEAGLNLDEWRETGLFAA